MLSRIAEAIKSQKLEAKGRVHTGGLRPLFKVEWDAPTSSVRVTSHGSFLAIIRLQEMAETLDARAIDAELELEPKHIMVVLATLDDNNVAMESTTVECDGRVYWAPDDGFVSVRLDACGGDAEAFAWLWFELSFGCSVSMDAEAKPKPPATPKVE